MQLSAGIEIKTAHPVSIFDAGAILANPGGTAIQLVGSGNTLTLDAGYPKCDPDHAVNSTQWGNVTAADRRGPKRARGINAPRGGQ